MTWVKRIATDRHVVYWPGMLISQERLGEFKTFFKDNFNIIIDDEHIIGTVTTGPDRFQNGKPVPETGGRADFFFSIHERVSLLFADANNYLPLLTPLSVRAGHTQVYDHPFAAWL